MQQAARLQLPDEFHVAEGTLPPQLLFCHNVCSEDVAAEKKLRGEALTDPKQQQLHQVTGSLHAFDKVTLKAVCTRCSLQLNAIAVGAFI